MRAKYSGAQVLAAMKKHNNNVAEVARELKVARLTVYRKLAQLTVAQRKPLAGIVQLSLSAKYVRNLQKRHNRAKGKK